MAPYIHSLSILPVERGGRRTLGLLGLDYSGEVVFSRNALLFILFYQILSVDEVVI